MLNEEKSSKKHCAMDKNHRFWLYVAVIVFLAALSASIIFSISHNRTNIIAVKSLTLKELKQAGQVEIEWPVECGVRIELSQKTYDEYLLLTLPPKTTCRVEFTNDKKINSMVVDYFQASECFDEEGMHPVIQLIPEYISEKGYDAITIRPLAGSGKFVIKDIGFMSMTELTAEHYAKADVFDFEIQQFEIEIDEDDYCKLEQLREEYLESGYRTETDNEPDINAKVKVQGEWYKTDLRFKGDAIADHLGYDKWSMRLDLKGDNCVYGMKKFSLQAIYTRGAMWESLIYDMYRSVSGVAFRYTYADVYINGVYKGVYAVEEAADKRAIENCQKREGPIVKMDETQTFEQAKYYIPSTKEQKRFKVFSANKTGASSFLSEYASYMKHQINSFLYNGADCYEVFDMDLYAKLYAISDVVGARHGRLLYSTRHYYNPITGLLEPIPYDECILEDEYFTFSNDATGYSLSELGKIFFRYERFREAYRKYLDEYFNNIENYMEGYAVQLRKDWMIVKRDVRHSEYEFDPLERMQQRRSIYQTLKETKPEISATLTCEEEKMKLILDNFSKVPIVILGIRLEDGTDIDFGLEYPYFVYANKRGEIPTKISVDISKDDLNNVPSAIIQYESFFPDELYEQEVDVDYAFAEYMASKLEGNS